MIKKLFFRLILIFVMVCVTGSGCGSSSDSATNIKMITSDEGALIIRDDILNNNITIIDTENSGARCNSSDNCYRFATRYDEVGSQTSVAVIDPSGHQFFFIFTSPLSGNRVYVSLSGSDSLDQDLKMYASYDSPELQCGEGCANVYNYSDPDLETGKYYKITVLENSDDSLEFVFDIWNQHFLELSEVPAEADRGTFFQGCIKIKKALHTDGENYYHLEDD